MRTTQTIGPWLVTATWDFEVSDAGPVQVTIEKGPNALPEDLLGGISTTVLRSVRIEAPEREVDPHVKEWAKELRHLRNEGVTDYFLAALARLYVAIAPHSRGPSIDIAESIDRAPSTVKNNLAEARRRGYLTVIPNRRGGTLTDEAHKILSAPKSAAVSRRRQASQRWHELLTADDD